MKILIIENDPERIKAFRLKFPNDKIIWVRSASGGIAKLNSESWDKLFLDMDLVGKGIQPLDSKSGYHVAEFLAQNPDKAPKDGVIIHSLNAVGSDKSAKLLRDAGIHTEQKPYYWK